MAKVQSSSSWKALHKADHRTLPGRRHRIRGAFNHIEQPLPHTACGCRFALYCAQVVGAWTWEQDGDSPSISVRPRSGCVIGGYVSDVYRLGGTYISPRLLTISSEFISPEQLFPMGSVASAQATALSGSASSPATPNSQDNPEFAEVQLTN